MQPMKNFAFSKGIKIARGSMGSIVYLGLKDQSAVAVKRINSEDLSSENSVNGLLNGKTAKHILKYLTVDKTDDFVYFVMPLMEYNLAEIIEDKNNPFHPDRHAQMRMSSQVLCGLQELHTLGIIHRDLKPSNILLGRSLTVHSKLVIVLRDIYMDTNYFQNEI